MNREKPKKKKKTKQTKKTIHNPITGRTNLSFCVFFPYAYSLHIYIDSCSVSVVLKLQHQIHLVIKTHSLSLRFSGSGWGPGLEFLPRLQMMTLLLLQRPHPEIPCLIRGFDSCYFHFPLHQEY